MFSSRYTSTGFVSNFVCGIIDMSTLIYNSKTLFYKEYRFEFYRKGTRNSLRFHPE